MVYKLVIEGRLPGLNEYIDAERSQRHAAARMKRETQDLVRWYARMQLGSQRPSKPVRMDYLWVEQNRRRDQDNIAFAKKFVQDALTEMGFLQGDGWKHVVGFSDGFAVDKYWPRVEVTITEVEEEEHGKNQRRRGGRAHKGK